MTMAKIRPNLTVFLISCFCLVFTIALKELRNMDNPHQSESSQPSDSNVYLGHGLRGRLACPLTSDPPRSLIVWSKNSQPILDELSYSDWSVKMTSSSRSRWQGGEKRGTRRVGVTRGGSSILFRSVVEGDKGNYTCLVYSPVQHSQLQVTFNVHVIDPPYLTVRPKPFYQRRPMQTVIMPCVSGQHLTTTSATSAATTKITWRKLGGQFPSLTRTLQDGGNLTIARLSVEDQGVYECIASNMVATVVTATILIIERGLNHGAYNVTAVMSSDSALICWYPAYQNSSQFGYLIWYRQLKLDISRSWSSDVYDEDKLDETASSWFTTRTVSSEDTCLMLHGLERGGSLYQFVVQVRAWSTGQVFYSESITAATTNFTERFALPGRPLNVTAKLNTEQGDVIIIITWSHPREMTSQDTPTKTSSSVEFYTVEYSTVPHRRWAVIAYKLNKNITSYLWTPASSSTSSSQKEFDRTKSRAASDQSDILSKLIDSSTVYRFRVVSHGGGGAGNMRASQPSRRITIPRLNNFVREREGEDEGEGEGMGNEVGMRRDAGEVGRVEEGGAGQVVVGVGKVVGEGKVEGGEGDDLGMTLFVTSLVISLTVVALTLLTIAFVIIIRVRQQRRQDVIAPHVNT